MPPPGASTALRVDGWGRVGTEELPRSQLHIAAWSGDRGLVRAVLRKGTHVNQLGHLGETALHWAAAAGFPTVVHELLLAKADVDTAHASPFVRVGVSKAGRFTALHWAASRGQAASIVELLEAGASVAAMIDGAETALHCAAYCGSFSSITALLEAGANVNCKANNGDTPLHRACDSGDDAAVLVLLENAADVHAKAQDGGTPLHRAGRKVSDAVVLALLKQGAEVNAVANDGDTPLHRAACAGGGPAVQALIENGADVHAVAKDGDTPLHRACDSRIDSAVRVLIENAVDVNAKAQDGDTPLHRAGRRGSSSVVQLLLENGADVNAVSNNGDTALHWACDSGNVAAVRIAPPAPFVNATDHILHTPLHLAVSASHMSVVGELLRYGAHRTALDGSLATPLLLASALGESEIVDLLGPEHPPEATTTPLHEAVKHGHLALVKNSALSGFLAKFDKNGLLPLHVAAGANFDFIDEESVKALLEVGPQVDCRTTSGQTPLNLALRWLDCLTRTAREASDDKTRRVDKDIYSAVLGYEGRYSGSAAGQGIIAAEMTKNVLRFRSVVLILMVKGAKLRHVRVKGAVLCRRILDSFQARRTRPMAWAFSRRRIMTREQEDFINE
ncbi:hypothetical protein I4F81_008058 [Pyropia yezoensis]|uniref:Uncharacterized protein n=1 Tax=Pyropia yezoensis TaxID=2788 RepID=A0ACC3C6L6_PYRYE|nr:hypothetical protein I4F81_008058 [Neopyropia yezoensis]